MAKVKPSGDHTKQRVHLVPKNTEEAITFMLKAFGEYPDEIRIGMYLEALEGCLVDEVWNVTKAWVRQPRSRAAHPGELLESIFSTRTAQEQRIEAARQQEIAEKSPTSSDDLDEIYEELSRQDPNNRLLRLRIAERKRLKSLGQTVDGQGEVSALFLAFMNGKGMNDA
jgi:ribosomal protein L12E/L44/L45/RPP1/RPP2